MKNTFLSIAFSTLLLAACTGNKKQDHQGHDMAAGKKATVDHASSSAEEGIKAVPVSFTKVDARANAVIKKVVGHYLAIKNSLVNDLSKDAAREAKALEKVLVQFDKSLLTAEQKIAYDKYEPTLKKHALQIAGSGDQLEQQRLLFSPMSEAVYALVKDFGTGQTLYHQYCPMAKDNQGALWISEVKEVKNPYYGATMLTCGRVEEVIN